MRATMDIDEFKRRVSDARKVGYASPLTCDETDALIKEIERLQKRLDDALDTYSIEGR